MKVLAKWNKGDAKITADLSLIFFEEENIKFVYSPSLDITGYGRNKEEAIKSFKTTLDIFFEYAHNKKTIESELRRLGWKFKNLKKKVTPPNLAKLLIDNEEFARIFNTHDFKKETATVEIPVMA